MWRKLRKVCQVANFWRVDSRRGGFHAGREYEKGGKIISPPSYFTRLRSDIGLRASVRARSHARRTVIAVRSEARRCTRLRASRADCSAKPWPCRRLPPSGSPADRPGRFRAARCLWRTCRKTRRSDRLRYRCAACPRRSDFRSGGGLRTGPDQVGHTGVHDDDLGSCGGRLAV